MPAPKNSRDPDAMVDAFIGGDILQEYPLSRLGAAAVPSLVRAMDDPRAFEGTWRSPATPIETLWELLVWHATPDIADRMAGFLDHPERRIRGALHGKLFWLGTPACAAALIRALTTREPEERTSILYAIKRLAREPSRRPAPGFDAAIYDALLERLSAGELGPVLDVAVALLRLDGPRALAYLTSSERFREDSPDLIAILLALDGERVVVPASILLAMMPEMRAASDARHAGEREGGCTFEVALSLLARSDPEAARPLIKEALRSEHALRRECASEALAIVEALEDALEVVQSLIDDEDGPDFDALGPERTNYYLAHEADQTIRNEGLVGFLMETPRPSIERTPDALDAIGAPQCAKAAREAWAMVRGLKKRKGETSFYNILRRPEVASRLDELEAPFLASDQEEDIPTLLRIYASSNPKFFRARKKKRR